jgi:hypothetical protein
LANLDDPVFLVSPELRVTKVYLELMEQKGFQGPVECQVCDLQFSYCETLTKLFAVTLHYPQAIIHIMEMSPIT